MWLSNIQLFPERNSVLHQLRVRAEIEYKDRAELPVLIMGNLKLSDKIVARLEPAIESHNRHQELSLPLTGSFPSGRERKLQVDFLAVLHEKQIDFIENTRLLSSDKNVKFSVELEIHYLLVEEARGNADHYDVLRKKVDYLTHTCTIEQSEWVREYSNYLGLGKYLLLEFPILEQKEPVQNTYWQDILLRAYELLSEMQARLQQGDWEEVIGKGRRLFELFKIDKKQEEAKGELNALFIQSNYNNQDVESLRQSIFHFFDFLSKFLHEKGKGSGAETLPVRIPLRPRKEDAYFVYSMSVGLTNMISTKAKKIQ